jgi:ligand-binding SRPBCC domain-containing protein
MEIVTNIKKPYSHVKKAFVDKNGKLFKKLIPFGCELLHYKGLRRGAIIKIMVFGRVVTFKVATYSTSNEKLYFNDILHHGKFYGIKFWSHRHTITSEGNVTKIKDTVTFTTKNKSLDRVYNILLRITFFFRSLKYKMFFYEFGRQ